MLESQKEWGKRVGFYAINNEADYKSAYEHYFGPDEGLNEESKTCRGGSAAPAIS